MDYDINYESPLLMGAGTILAEECRKSDKQEQMRCLVCGGQMAHYNLGAKICRACASFYRRTITEKLRYICQADGRCNVEMTDLRAKCKACRFEKCQQIGLTEAALNSRRTNTGRRLISDSPPSCPLVNTTCSGKPTNSRLSELVKGYDAFLNSQRSLFVVVHPDLGFSDKFCMPKMVGLHKMQQNSVSLLFQYFNFFGPLAKLPSNQRIKVISQAYHDISNFHRAYLTSVSFPDLDDDRVMVTNGYFLKMDLSLLSEFMDGYMSAEKLSAMEGGAMGSIMNKILKNCRKFKALKMRKEDAVVLWFLSAYKHAERLDLVNEEITEYKESLVTEWANDLCRMYGAHEGGTQLARILAFNIESDTLAEEMTNLQILSKVSFPNESSGEIEEFIDELSLNDHAPSFYTNL
ncbi:Nuclear hormone receptor family member nhr-28 [Aphelenchoides bicaudatus]|nr:Nuclear hormone receptor family member nhr-28 [Aphelenchoides bicaudatus]